MSKEIDIVKVQQRGKGSFMVTIPKDAALILGIKAKNKMRVLLDKDKKKLIYEPIK